MLLAVCARVKELTIRITTQQDKAELMLTAWAKKAFTPQNLNVVSAQAFVPQLL